MSMASKSRTTHVAFRLKSAWGLLLLNPLTLKDRPRDNVPKDASDYLSQMNITLQGALAFDTEDMSYVSCMREMHKANEDAFRLYLTTSNQLHLCLATSGHFIAQVLGIDDIITISWSGNAHKLVAKFKGSNEEPQPRKPVFHTTDKRDRPNTSNLQRTTFRDVCATNQHHVLPSGQPRAPPRSEAKVEILRKERPTPLPDAAQTLNPKRQRARGGKKIREAKEKAAVQGEHRPVTAKQGIPDLPSSETAELIKMLSVGTKPQPVTTVQQVEQDKPVDAAALGKLSSASVRLEFQATDWATL